MAPVSTLSCRKVLITGGNGGLGRAFAEALIARKISVIIVGRTEKALAETAKEIGAADYFVLDVSKIDSIKPFIDKVLEKHPDLDGLINNAGVQKPFQALGPEYSFDLEVADQEIDIDIRAPMHLCIGLIKHFNSLKDGAVIMNVGSVLGWNPSSIINPVYNGAKSWVHSFTANLRTQLAAVDSKIKVVEIVPPSVETALHRDRKDPDDNKKAHGNKTALSVQEFIEEIEKGWEENRDVCTAGPGHKIVKAWTESIGEMYAEVEKGYIEANSGK